MKNRFEVEFSQGVIDFFEDLEKKTREKIIFNIHKTIKVNDNKLFKKLSGEIWEFRTLYNRKQYRLFAFWDKTKDTRTLVVTTHGIIKKSQKTPPKEILKAIKIMKKYYSEQ
ncbi:MAG: type II toxin-antitoxin system RelE/ParE family toxin [Bacteroidetes bacterium]|nr:type II toxin-antitoxin system RelE/ParE family toxin [Bacteroidota bacterium]